MDDVVQVKYSVNERTQLSLHIGHHIVARNQHGAGLGRVTIGFENSIQYDGV